MNAEDRPDPNIDDFDDRSSFAKAWDIAYQLIAVCAMAAIPAVAGYFLDRWLRTVVVFSVLGLVFGLVTAIYQFKRLLRRFEAQQANERDDHGGDKKLP